MNDRDRLTDIPSPLRWFLVAFKQVGFPVMVCVYLAYMQFVDAKEQRKTMGEFKEVIAGLKTSIDQQNLLLRRRNRNPND